MDNFRSKVETWMQGRYGPDELSRTLLVVAVVCWFLELFLNTGVISVLAWAALIVAAWRMLSRNISRRLEENERFCTATEKPRREASQALARFRNRKTTLYFKCDGCKTWLSVPRGKGKLRVVCPNCKKEQIRKS